MNPIVFLPPCLEYSSILLDYTSVVYVWPLERYSDIHAPSETMTTFLCLHIHIYVCKNRILDITHCTSLGDVIVHLSSKGEHPNESNLGSEMEEFKSPSCLAASTHIPFAILFYIHISVVLQKLLSSEVYTSKRGESLNMYITDITSRSKKCKVKTRFSKLCVHLLSLQ